MRSINEITINGESLEKIIESHEDWLNDSNTGKRADLSDADLRHADLRHADLRQANLRQANLRQANLSNADLRQANLSNADLRQANLRHANLRHADLRHADLSDADLRQADLDFSCMPLWCGDLKANYDDKQIIQQFYHVMSHIKFSSNVSAKLKKILTEDNLNIANKFHRINECGKI